MSKINWSGAALITSPSYCLVITEEDYHKALDEIKIDKDGRDPWLSNERCGATKHTFDDIHVVAVRYDEQDNLSVYAILVHEAVHIWQEFCKSISENNPSIEFEAYAIQMISINLMSMFDDQIKEKLSSQSNPH